MIAELARHMGDAWARRAALHADDGTDAYRAFHGWHEGCPGLEVDRYGDAAVIRCPSRLTAQLGAIADIVAEVTGLTTLIGKSRSAAPVALRGSMPPRPTLVRELGLRFAVELWQPRNPGLFLDARPARAWIRGHSEGRRVLNLFAFTGSLGIAAAAGGARGVTHVDSQKRALARCRDNHDHNGLHIDDRDLVRVNVYQHLRRASAQRRQFDAIIADVPPESYASRRNDRTPGARGVAGLAASMTRMLAPGGWMLCFFHHGGERGEREAEVLRAADAPLEIAWRGGSGPDFPEADLRRSLRLTAFARAA